MIFCGTNMSVCSEMNVINPNTNYICLNAWCQLQNSVEYQEKWESGNDYYWK
jgi:hypothetical protein